jgi:hypothetical protein
MWSKKAMYKALRIMLEGFKGNPQAGFLKIGSLGPDSDVINGQLLPIQSREVRFPIGYIAVAQRVPNITPTVPPQMGSGSVGGATSIDSAAVAAANPWSLMHSPLPWAIIFLVVGLLGLRFIHWRPMS